MTLYSTLPNHDLVRRLPARPSLPPSLAMQISPKIPLITVILLLCPGALRGTRQVPPPQAMQRLVSSLVIWRHRWISVTKLRKVSPCINQEKNNEMETT